MWNVSLQQFCDACRNNKLTIGFTNGCFDLLHEGHMHLLYEANKYCDVLIVGLNSDKSVSNLKPGRPIQTYKKRMQSLKDSKFVDLIFEFHTESELSDLIRTVLPDVQFKGADYHGRRVIGQAFSKKLIFIPLIEGVSTTKILSMLPPR